MDPFIAETPFFTAEQRNLATSVAGFVMSEIETRSAEEAHEGAEEVDASFRSYLDVLAKADLLRYAIAQPGGRLDVRSLCLLRELLSYSSPLADLAFVMQGLGTYPLSLAAPEHVRDFWLGRAAEGQAIAAFALTEAEAGSDVSGIKTFAVRDGDTYIIQGAKRFISNVGLADFYTVFARTGTRADGRPELSAFVVSARMPDFRVSERTEMIAAHPIGEITLDNCRVPAEDMVGPATGSCSRCGRLILSARASARPPAEWPHVLSKRRFCTRRAGGSLVGRWPSINSFRRNWQT
jgi:acyl-CoA dehydrogenase